MFVDYIDSNEISGQKHYIVFPPSTPEVWPGQPSSRVDLVMGDYTNYRLAPSEAVQDINIDHITELQHLM